MATADEEKYPARCIKCKGAFSVTRKHSAYFGTQTKYACKSCSEAERRRTAAEQETEKARLDKETEEAKSKAEVAKAKVAEVAAQKEIEEIKLRQLEVETQKANAEEKKAHWEQMRAALQAKDSEDKLQAQIKLADVQRIRAESAEKVLKDFKQLREDGKGVTSRDLTAVMYTIHQPSVIEREHEIGRRPKIWTAPHPLKSLPED